MGVTSQGIVLESEQAVVIDGLWGLMKGLVENVRINCSLAGQGDVVSSDSLRREFWDATSNVRSYP